ncbi:MAG: hypothetical protein P4L33_18335 [Capsulimonadaceae bacterium]|nr:hypothetical protein [Capsulimonadaceae bacterium]
MNNIKTHMLARPLGYVLAILVVLTSSYLTLGLSRIAQAQSASNSILWAVLDFNNNTGYGGSEIGRQAADALDVDLFNTTLNDGRKIEVLKRSEIASSVSSLGLQFPLDVVDIQRLGRNLDARAVVSGDVLSITRNDKHQVQVVVAVRVTDVASGELINGALAQGTSAPRYGTVDEDAYVGEAIRKAAFAAVERIKRFNLPIATVLNYQGPDQVLINKGSRDGYFVGMNMIVLRNGAETGRIKVGTVDQDSAIAGIEDRGTGIRPQDRCHALFTMPSYTVRNGQVVTTDDIASGPTNYSHKKSNFAGIGGIILAVLAAAFLIYLVNRGASSANVGGATIGSVVAQAINNFGSATLISDPSNYGVRVQWANGNINPLKIVEWNVYRDNSSPVGGVGLGGGTSSTSSVTITTLFADGPEIVAPQGTYWVIDDGQVRTVYFKYAVTGGAGSGTSSTSSTSSTSTVSVAIGSLGSGVVQNVPGVTYNHVHNYEVTAVYAQEDATSGTIGYEETPLNVGVAKGYATPELAVDPTAKTTTVNSGGSSVTAYSATGVTLSNVILSWNTVGSTADDYVVDYSTTPTFANKYTLSPTGNLLGTGISVTANLRSHFGLSSTSSHVIYYRIGCRHSADVPGPYKDTQHATNPDANPNGGSYLYAATTGYFTGS